MCRAREAQRRRAFCSRGLTHATPSHSRRSSEASLNRIAAPPRHTSRTCRPVSVSRQRFRLGLAFSGLGFCLGCALVLHTRSAAAQAAGEAVVSWNAEHQVMRGFGASSAFFGARISEQDADWFFSKDTGIGLSMLRIQIGL